MPSEAILQAAADFASRIRARFGERVAWVRMYGSQARGDATEGSDVDLAAVVRELTWSEKIEAINLACDVSLERGLHLSAMVTSEHDFQRLIELESRYARNILAEGIAA